MNHSVRTMIEMNVAILVFVVAVSTGIYLFQSGGAALQTAYVTGRIFNTNLHAALNPIAGDGTRSGAEVLQMIAGMQEDEVEIVVDGVVYPSSLEREELTASGLVLSGRYASAWERDRDGRIERIRFALYGGAE